jgi:hypothetical protein
MVSCAPIIQERQDVPSFPDVARAPVSASVHGKLLEQMIPDWLIAASPARRAAMKAASTVHRPAITNSRRNSNKS